ncbi:hypothetical protein NHQ30_011228 [Ciborinia camelliae]|nr:hypothetical protein NHQ30_011228 [Ciborinia camelliae]
MSTFCFIIIVVLCTAIFIISMVLDTFLRMALSMTSANYQITILRMISSVEKITHSILSYAENSILDLIFSVDKITLGLAITVLEQSILRFFDLVFEKLSKSDGLTAALNQQIQNR